MEEQTQSTKEIIRLHTPGAIPGIPGEHGPGRYEVDWAARTVTPVGENGQPIVVQTEPESEQDTEATQPLQEPSQPQGEPAQPPEEAHATPEPEAHPEQAPTEESTQA